MADPARALSAGVAAVVEAVRSSDLEAFVAASAQLEVMGVEQVGVVESAVIGSLLEERFPDGLDSDDVRAILTRCAQGAAWWPDVEPDALLLVLVAALGVADPDEQPPVGRATLARHAAVVIADLSTARPAMLADHLALAIGEIRRAQTIELP